MVVKEQNSFFKGIILWICLKGVSCCLFSMALSSPTTVQADIIATQLKSNIEHFMNYLVHISTVQTTLWRRSLQIQAASACRHVLEHNTANQPIIIKKWMKLRWAVIWFKGINGQMYHCLSREEILRITSLWYGAVRFEKSQIWYKKLFCLH